LPLSTCHIDNKKLFLYLDEAHTRGSDLKLPLNAHGIVTLGKGMNKDKLMQAVMRLRDLDFKQSIVLWGSEAISAEIAKVNSINSNNITSKHILSWVTFNTIQKNEKDLYPVTIEKFKYVIKSKALDYQKRIRDIPIQSLITACETHVPDGIVDLYSKTPQERNPKDILNTKMSGYLSDFYSNLKKEMVNLKIKNPTLEDYILHIEKEQDEFDRPNMKKILNQVEPKLPKNIMTINTNFDCDQENEREIEEMQQAETVLVKQMKPMEEIGWDANTVYDRDFKQKSLKVEFGYPTLKELKKCFEFTNNEKLKSLKWNNKIFATENFINTVQDINIKTQQYQNEYLRPVNMLLIHKKAEVDPCYLLISGAEANKLIEIFEIKPDPQVLIMHVDDIDGATSVPTSRDTLTNEDKQILTLIRLFNGSCNYNNEEADYIKKCLGFIDNKCFSKDELKSKRLYNELEEKNYIMNCFATNKLATMLKDRTEKILPGAEAKEEVDLQKVFSSIVSNSLAEDSSNISDLAEAIKFLVKIRGKESIYQRSTLKSILS
jgi:hypothetical protein